MQVQLKPWGNSQGIRFSREFLALAGMKTGDVLNAEIQDGKIILSKRFVHRTLEERAAAYEGELNLCGEDERGGHIGTEVW